MIMCKLLAQYRIRDFVSTTALNNNWKTFQLLEIFFIDRDNICMQWYKICWCNYHFYSWLFSKYREIGCPICCWIIFSLPSTAVHLCSTYSKHQLLCVIRREYTVLLYFFVLDLLQLSPVDKWSKCKQATSPIHSH